MRVALIQFNATADKEDNIRRAAAWVEQALKRHKATFVVLPEIFNWRGDTRTAAAAHIAEKIPGASLAPLMALAKQYRATIVAGSVLEATSQSKKFYNTSVVINAQGRIVAKYRKIHLFDARLGDKIVNEADFFIAGKQKVIAHVDGFKVGLSICYDLRFPDLYHRYAVNGANVLLVPSCFTKVTGQAHWETLARARAIENLAYVLAPNQVGTDARGMPAYGHSMIVSPWGEIIACGRADKEEIVVGDIKMEEVAAARAKLPSLIREKRYGK